MCDCGWRNIETAPKVGSNVLLHCPARGVVRGWWSDERFARKPRPFWTHDREGLFGKAATRADQPTHWRPLPAPPDAARQADHDD